METAITCAPKINRSFLNRDGAFQYLASRGFLCGPRGWSNGRWAATVAYEHNAFHVAVWLRLSEAAKAEPLMLTNPSSAPSPR